MAKVSSPMGRVGSVSRYVLLAACTLSALLPGYIMVTGAMKTQDEFLNSPWSLPLHPNFTAFTTSWAAGLPGWFVNTIIVTVGSVVGV